jgi:putative oxidoreductase
MDDASREPRLLFPSLAGFYDWTRPLSWLVLRFGVGLLLLIHGYPKIGRTNGPAQLMEALPILKPYGAALATSLMLIEFVGGLAIILGLFTRFFAAAAAIEMAVLTFVIYWGHGFSWLARGYEFTLLWGFMCFAIALRGGGPYSLDRVIGREL